MGKYVLAQYNYNNPPVGFGVVNLGGLNWNADENGFYSITIESTIKKPQTNDDVANIKCAKYLTTSKTALGDKDICVSVSGAVRILDSEYTGMTGTQFKAAMSGVKLLYEKADNVIPYDHVPYDCYALYHNSNIWDEEWEQGGYSSDSGNKSEWGVAIRNKNYMEVVPSTSYFVKSPILTYVFFYDTNKQYINYNVGSGNREITTPSNCKYINFCTNNAYGTTYKHDIAIYKNSTSATARNTKQYLLDRLVFTDITPSTKYPATIDGYDVVDLETLNYTRTRYTYGTFFRSDNLQGVMLPSTDASALPPNYLLSFDTIPQRWSLNPTGNGIEYSVSPSGSFGIGYPGDSPYPDAVTFKAAMSGVKLIYEPIALTTKHFKAVHESTTNTNGYLETTTNTYYIFSDMEVE